MTKIKNKIEVQTISKEYIIPVEHVRGIGEQAITESNKPKHDRRQDHGTRGYEPNDDYYGKPKQDILADDLDVAASRDAMEYTAFENDFALWEEQLGKDEDTEQEREWTTSTKKFDAGFAAELNELASDLEKVGLTPGDIHRMSPDELEDFHKWLLRRTKKA